jgi:hypothetical protein
VQAPLMSQSLNRYSYVMNNPLSLVDPSGFSWLSKFFKRLLPLILRVVINYFVPGLGDALYKIYQAADKYAAYTKMAAAALRGALGAAGNRSRGAPGMVAMASESVNEPVGRPLVRRQTAGTKSFAQSSLSCTTRLSTATRQQQCALPAI